MLTVPEAARRTWLPPSVGPAESADLLLVTDASTIVKACLSQGGFAPIEHHDLVAPRLLWSEVPSVLHEMLSRREIAPTLARTAFERFGSAPVAARHPEMLSREAWRAADELGWAKTYDAEYVPPGIAPALSACHAPWTTGTHCVPLPDGAQSKGALRPSGPLRCWGDTADNGSYVTSGYRASRVDV
jgi:predicted nucleic acid-binding protein